MKILKKNKPLLNYKFLLLVIIVLSIGHVINYDNDFWFTINQGRYILNNGFPNFAIGSIHDIDFLYQSWGTGTLFYIIYNNFGFIGIVSLLTIVLSLISYFFYKLCYVISSNKNNSYKITCIMILLFSFWFLETRPHIFTSLNLIIMLYLLESYLKYGKKKYLYFLPLISLLEVNMHGIYFFLLLIIISPYIINGFKFNIFGIKSNGYSVKPILITFIIMFLVGFINPYGYKTIIYGFKSYFSSSLFNNNIYELLAPDFHYFFGKIILVSILVIYGIFFNHHKNVLPRYWMLLFGSTYLVLDAIKSYNLFLICSLFPLAFLLSKIDYDYRFSKNYSLFYRCLLVIIIFMVFINIKEPNFPETHEFINYLDSITEENKDNVKLYTNYYDGSYAEYRGYNCYIDPRGEIFLKIKNGEDIFKEYNDLEDNKIDYQEFLNKYNFDYLLLDKEDNLYLEINRYGSPYYHEIKSNEKYSLYEKLNK